MPLMTKDERRGRLIVGSSVSLGDGLLRFNPYGLETYFPIINLGGSCMRDGI